MRRLRDICKAIPGLLLATFIAAASVAPRDATSNLSQWAQKIGIHDLPTFATDKAFDRRIQLSACIVFLAYLILAWDFPISASTIRTWIRNLSGRTIPGDAAPIQYEILADEDLRKQASKWLAHKLSERRLHVRSVTLFGSITHDHFATSDVDVIVSFEEMRDHQIAAAVRRIKGILAAEFIRTFGHKLHVTFFCAGEAADHVSFLAKQANPEVIYDRRLSASRSSGVR
ncbi:MAG TPA: hypothetical protein VIM02_02275 [Rhizomicrobium sp.]|jgi:predicted nucleotidyltransferase